MRPRFIIAYSVHLLHPARVFLSGLPDVRAHHSFLGAGHEETCLNHVLSPILPGADRSDPSSRNNQAIYIVPVEITVQPLEIPLAKGGQAFWLTPRVIAHVVTNEETKVQDIYVISVEFETQSSDRVKITTPAPLVLIGSFPTSTSDNFRYIPESGILVFSDFVYEDGELRAAKEGDEAWQGRGNTALVYDETYVRHWDTYRGPKHQSLFSVKLARENGIWSLGEEFINLLAGTKHVSVHLNCDDVSNIEGVALSRTPPSSRLGERTISMSPRPTSCIPPWILNYLLPGTPNRM